MIRLLRRLFPLETLKQNPAVQGHLRMEVRERGKLVTVREGFNIWTLSGREFLTELMSLEALNPSRTPFRNDRIASIGVGTGAQPEISNILSLVQPIAYKPGEFLAPLATPASFPVTGVDAARTAVQFTREFGRNEISIGPTTVIITEAGLFTDGDPNNDWAVPAPTDYATAASRAPMAYKTIEPVSKTQEFTLRTIWEVRLV